MNSITIATRSPFIIIGIILLAFFTVCMIKDNKTTKQIKFELVPEVLTDLENKSNNTSRVFDLTEGVETICRVSSSSSSNFIMKLNEKAEESFSHEIMKYIKKGIKKRKIKTDKKISVSSEILHSVIRINIYYN